MQYCLPNKQASLQGHYEAWRTCQMCPLGQHRHQIVLWKGYVPCDVAFIGEAPGTQEDLEGLPFIGRAGQLLDELVERAEYNLGFKAPTYAVLNTVACAPPNNREPEKIEVKTCFPRLQQMLRIAEPKVLILMGDTAKLIKKHLKDAEIPLPYFEMLHPAFTIRQGVRYGQYYQQSITVLMDAFSEVVG